jgi:hypothetical protein
MQHTARLDKHELQAMLPSWSNRERGGYLQRLFRLKGVDPDRLYSVVYYPERQCWLLTQSLDRSSDRLVPLIAEDAFYAQALTELRRTARTAFAAAAARSVHFAANGCKYELPARPQELTAQELIRQLGAASDAIGVRFDSEGGWHAHASKH